MILYGHPLSGNTHKVRLLLAALKLPYEERTVDVTTGVHKQPEFLDLNPRGQLPVLSDSDGRTLHDAQAILVYLARQYDSSGRWLPSEARELAQVVGWLSFAANEIQNGAQALRMHYLLGVPIALEATLAATRASLALLDARLARRSFLELERATIADLACFPCLALVGDGKVSVEDYAHVRAWIERVRSLPFYVGMPGIEART